MLPIFLYINIILFLFIYFWLCWIFVAAQGFFLVAASRGYSLIAVHGLSRCSGFSCCGAQALGHADFLRAHGLSSCRSLALEHRLNNWYMGLDALRHVGSSWIRDGNRVSCIGRQFCFFFLTTKPPGKPCSLSWITLPKPITLFFLQSLLAITKKPLMTQDSV